MKLAFLLLVALSVGGASAVEWKNVDPSHYLGGRKASAGYLQGKPVLVVLWDAANEESVELLSQLEDVWTNFKGKQIAFLGGHVGGAGGIEAAKASVGKLGLSFSVYEGAGLAVSEPAHKDLPFVYVADETGKIVYRGRKGHIATQAVVQALTDMDSPRNLMQWRRFLDYELGNLPAHAYIRLNEFRKKFPKEAEEYLPQARKLVGDDDVKKVAKLVSFAKRAKDAPALGSKNRAKYESLVKDVIESCAALKGVADPRLSQEAKNALADLQWTAAAF